MIRRNTPIIELTVPDSFSSLALYRRLAVFVWVLGAALALLLFGFAPPTEAIGDAGWWLAGASVLVSLGMAAWIARPASRITVSWLSWGSFVGLAQTAMLQWLAGGVESPYNELLLLNVFASASLHPPRRMPVYLVLVAAVAIAPLIYDSWDSETAGATAAYLVLLTGIALLSLLFVRGTDEQKAGLRAAEQLAEESARTDPLTRLANRRAFDETLGQELSRVQRTGAPLSLLVGDLDGFKRINDEFGHLNGDEVLTRSAAAIEAAIRRGDRCFRWGGDEFAVLLPDTTLADATRVCERVTVAVEVDVQAPDGQPVTISCGLAELAEGMTAEELTATADLALYDEKARRRADLAI
jgi:diguanylate cyclase (GGDEF)-like protein